ncbi:MAG: hypothetical protein V1746_06310 [bacterium]
MKKQNDEAFLDERETLELREKLRELAVEQLPGAQEQRWAWMRLEARLLAPKDASRLFFPFLRLAGWGVVAVLALGLGASFWKNGIMERPPIIASMSPSINVVTFHAKEVNADVIWATGYDYLPASSQIR